MTALRRSVRAWTGTVESATTPDVPGATVEELRQLAALGGIAASIAGGASHEWPENVRTWAADAPQAPYELITIIRQALETGQDAFAEAYNCSISSENRRRLGTVFTPDVLVEHMLDMVAGQLPSDPTCVVDPGAGVGAFTLAAARRWPNARVVAVDINPVTLGFLGARLAYESRHDAVLGKRPGSIELRLADFIDELPKVMTDNHDGPVAVIGNPPYTRTQALTADLKRRAASFGDGLITSGHANLALLFQALTFASIRPQDVSCFVVPGSVVYTRAARDLRTALWRSRRPLSVRIWPTTSRAFTGRSVQAAVICLGPEWAKRKPAFKISRAQMDMTGVKVLEERTVSRREASPLAWYWPDETPTETDDSVPLGQIVTVRRGVATGANHFFFLTDSAAAKLPVKALVTAIPSLRLFNDDVLDEQAHAALGDAGAARWLLAADPKAVPKGALLTYVERGVPEVRDRHLCQQREKWWAITDLPRPQLLISPLSKGAFKVVVNSIGAVPSNNLIGITMKGGDAATLAEWLRSETGQQALRRVSRQYPGGSYKIEPGDLRKVQLPMKLAAKLGAPTQEALALER